ncbi:RNA-guided pseudouridylation complex pseudouridine synthase subunit Cbf5 [Haladaptatus sp. F3-133]|jgi:predicted rRNA pseudouridine synthase|uniref:RNA-guided pseudouridylation complex pseudouridine synthase subunit Cbf5 n=1 Tax=Halorutilus salinus TaxID=2487751 RepID=A0A9Q4C291_9EURY|nr:RNA-guided pseudouridylation complex pseudouridine synthase subunit Cbf5 [Halorutilus salinus]MCX2817757.1 RNA-guided pseudouridylation complex pseudouridine synthase subunit Cbf5 [Halorutilus salinus]
MRDKGVVVVDKPSGPTSHEVASWVAEIMGVDKAAHTGTLDPRVTGCLPVLFGTAARVSGLFAEASKAYVFVLELHAEPTRSVEEVFDEFEGEIYQRPPVQGSARRELRVRNVERLEPLERGEGDDANRYLGRVVCGSGTYVRKLCHDIGLALGVGGHMAELRRTRSGCFGIEDAWYLQSLADAVAVRGEQPERLADAVFPLVEVLETRLPRIDAAPNTVGSVENGAPLYAPGTVSVDDDATPDEDCFVVADGEAVAVGTFHGHDAEPVFTPDTVLV